MEKLSSKVDMKFTNQNVTRQNNDQFLGFYQIDESAVMHRKKKTYSDLNKSIWHNYYILFQIL
jgi:hypothetical protein